MRAEKADSLPLLLELLAYAQVEKYPGSGSDTKIEVEATAETEAKSEVEAEADGQAASETTSEAEVGTEEVKDTEENGDADAAAEAEWRASKVSAAADAFLAPEGPIDTVKLATFYGCAQADAESKEAKKMAKEMGEQRYVERGFAVDDEWQVERQGRAA